MEETPKLKWSAVEAPTSNQTVIWDSNNDRVAVVDEFPKGAKSSLIASAPDLYEACKIVVETYEGDGMEQMGVRDVLFYRVCKAALNSAVKK